MGIFFNSVSSKREKKRSCLREEGFVYRKRFIESFEQELKIAVKGDVYSTDEVRAKLEEKEKPENMNEPSCQNSPVWIC